MTQKSIRACNIPIEIDIATEFSGWNQCDFEKEPAVNRAVDMAVTKSRFAALLQNKDMEISVVLCDDDFIQTLNKQYRGKDKPTNVLSFPQSNFNEPDSLSDFVSLGDIILAYQTIKHEAQEQNKSFQHHFIHLVTHGTLHLMGYDHEDSEEANEMEALEIVILNALGIKNPYSNENFVS